MRTLIALAIVCGLLGPLIPASAADEPLKRYLYVASRDGAGGKGDKGISVYDSEGGHKLVWFILMPKLGGTRGACAATGRMWIAHGNDRVLCLDLKTDKVLWEIQHTAEESGFDRVGVTPDGKKLYAPSGWWSKNRDVKVIDAGIGKLLKRIPVAPKGGLHNLVVSHDGKKVVVSSTNFDMLSVIDTEKDEVALKVGPSIGVIQPLTINGGASLAYINTHLYRKDHGPGFEIGDLKTGKILHVVGQPERKERKARCHGIGLSVRSKKMVRTKLAVAAIVAVAVLGQSPKAEPPDAKDIKGKGGSGSSAAIARDAGGRIDREEGRAAPLRWDDLRAGREARPHLFAREHPAAMFRSPGELTPDTWFHDGHLRTYALLNLSDVVRSVEIARGKGPVLPASLRPPACP